MTAPVHIKICGIRTTSDAEMCVEAGAHAIGLNLIAASPRSIDAACARAIVGHIAGRARTVLVVADLDVPTMRELLRSTGADSLQLHGDEPPEVVLALLPRAYKAVRVGGPEDLVLAESYPGPDLLIDAKVPGALGGTGHPVDWDLVAPVARRRRLTLAGGLRPDNVARAIERVRPFSVDVASGVESRGEPGCIQPRPKRIHALQHFYPAKRKHW